MAFIYSILPEYTRSIDTDKDNSYFGDSVTLKSYTSAIDESVFEVLRSSVREIMSFQDVYKINEEYLPYFSFLLGYRWNDYIDVSLQRNLVANILQLYKRKGTIFSFHFNLYNIDQNVTIKEPYKDLFVLNRSKLSSNKHLPSQDYYSYGIIVIQMNAFITEIYEIIESIRPAGWKFLIENNRKIYTDMNLKPLEKERITGTPSLFIRENKDDYMQYQITNSLQFNREDAVILTMVCQNLTAVQDLQLKFIQNNTILAPKEQMGYNTFLRYGQHVSEIHEIEFVRLKLERTGLLGLMFTRHDTLDYDEMCNEVHDKLLREDHDKYDYNSSIINSELMVNSLQYGRMKKDQALILDSYDKRATEVGHIFNFDLCSPEMKLSLKHLKIFTIDSYIHELTDIIKTDNILEDTLEGYSLSKISIQHFSRRLVK